MTGCYFYETFRTMAWLKYVSPQLVITEDLTFSLCLPRVQMLLLKMQLKNHSFAGKAFNINKITTLQIQITVSMP